MTELKEQLDQERDQRRLDREKAEADLRAAVQKAQSEAQEELKRLSDAALRRETEQQEVINKLQVMKGSMLFEGYELIRLKDVNNEYEILCILIQIVEKQSSSQVDSLKLKLVRYASYILQIICTFMQIINIFLCYNYLFGLG